MADRTSPPFALTPGLLESMAEVISIVVKVPKADDEDNPKTDAEFERSARRIDENMPPVSDNFEWKVSGVVRGTDPKSNKRVRLQAFTLTGRRIVVDCRQRLEEKVVRTDGKTGEVEVVPDLFNPDHYGRSPQLSRR